MEQLAQKSVCALRAHELVTRGSKPGVKERRGSSRYSRFISITLNTNSPWDSAGVGHSHRARARGCQRQRLVPLKNVTMEMEKVVVQ